MQFNWDVHFRKRIVKILLTPPPQSAHDRIPSNAHDNDTEISELC